MNEKLTISDLIESQRETQNRLNEVCFELKKANEKLVLTPIIRLCFFVIGFLVWFVCWLPVFSSRLTTEIVQMQLMNAILMAVAYQVLMGVEE